MFFHTIVRRCGFDICVGQGQERVGLGWLSYQPLGVRVVCLGRESCSSQRAPSLTILHPCNSFSSAVHTLHGSCFSQVGSVHISLESTYANGGNGAGISDEVNYEYIITNNGLLTLYDIAVETEAPVNIVCIDTDGKQVAGSSGGVEGLAAYPSKGLAPAELLACSATAGVSRAEVNAVQCLAALSS